MIGLGILTIVFLLSLMWLPLPYDTSLWKSIKDLGHIPLFGLLALVLLQVLPHLFRPFTWPRERYYGIALVGVLVLGLGTEFMQFFEADRDADAWDLFRDVAGACCALGLWATYDQQLMRWSRWRQVPGKHVMRAGVFLLLLATLTPAIVWSKAYWYRSTQFPKICQFSTYWEMKFVRVYDSDLSVIDPPPEWEKPPGDTVGYVVFNPHRYPRIVIDEPYPDWHSLSFLSFSIFSDLKEERTLFLRIHDQGHTGHYEDRYNREILVVPGLNHVRISLDEIKHAPAGRSMDLRAIQSIQLFAVNPPHPFALYVDNFQLE